jgi:TonB family protein
MPDSLPRMPPKGPLTTERRQNPRYPVRPTEYIEIGDSNGGIILDISEGGMAVASAQALVGHQTLRFRFQLPRSLETIETFGEINWIGETKKRAGVRFVDLPLAAREQIRKWIDSQTSGHSNVEQKPNGSAVSSLSPQISQAPRHEPSRRELVDKQTIFAAHGPNPPKNLNPFSPPLSGPLDEPEIDEPEPEDEEKNTVDSNAQSPSEKRAERRLPMTASTYVQLSDGNGGLMANLSKTGFCVRAAKMLEADHLPVVRFQLPNARDFVESSAWIVWKSPSKKTAGARFENLSAEAQSQIAQWIDSQPLPKNASIKNPPSKNSISPSPSANSRSEQRERISEPLKTPASITAVPVTPPLLTLMSPDSVPIPAYISRLAISQNAQPSVPPANTPSPALPLAPSLAKVPPMVSPSKPAPTSAEKTLAPVPVIIPATLPAKPAAITSAPVSTQSQKLSPVPVPLPAAPVASSNKASNLASPAAPRVVPPPSANLPDKSLPVASLPDTSRGLKNPQDQLAAAPKSKAPFVPTTPAPIFNEPDWSVAPKRPTGYWKTAAMIVVIAGTLFGTATFLRSKKSVTPASTETAQNSSVAATVAAVTPSSDQGTNSSASNQPTPAPTASTSNAGSSGEFHDTPRNTSSNSSSKGDEQFVDERRPARSQPQISRPPIQSNHPRAASDQPSSSEAASAQSGTQRTQNPSAEEGSGFPTVIRQVQSAPTAASSNANGEAASQPDPSSAPPAPPAQSAPRNQQPDANLASAAGVTQNSSTTHPAAASENNPPKTSASINPSPAAGALPAASTSAAIPDPVPAVSVFSRFRAIRTTSDAARPAGSDLQIGRLKSGPAPAYPVEAQRRQIQGTVELEVLVGADGNILSVHLVKGPPELASVAMGTVRSWQYGPTTLGGQPVETDQSIYFTFKLAK